jgi:hypothetical protein
MKLFNNSSTFLSKIVDRWNFLIFRRLFFRNHRPMKLYNNSSTFLSKIVDRWNFSLIRRLFFQNRWASRRRHRCVSTPTKSVAEATAPPCRRPTFPSQSHPLTRWRCYKTRFSKFFS